MIFRVSPAPLLPLTLLFMLVAAPLVCGHGIPIAVSVSGNRLVVSGGVSGGEGFATNLFVEQGEDGEPFATTTLPGFGPVILWQIPGFEIRDMDAQSNLSMEILSRPVANRMPQEYRTLWYWNNQTEQVEPPEPISTLHLLALDKRTAKLAADDPLAPPPLLLADPMEGHLLPHHHGLLSYALANDPIPPTGVFGFFARLTSTVYEPSEPFLVAFNRNTDYAQMAQAALDINMAAFLSGDFNRDGIVDAADYTIWRNTLGSSEILLADGDGSGTIDELDYQAWRQNYGAIDWASVASIPLSHPVPVPATAWLAAWGLILLNWRRFRIRKGTYADSQQVKPKGR